MKKSNVISERKQKSQMIKVEVNCSSKMSDEMMEQVRGMGVEYLAVNFRDEDANYKSVKEFQDRAGRHDLKIGNAGNPALQKCTSIILGKTDRNTWIRKYNEFTKVLGQAGIPINYLTWQPNGILRTRVGAGKYNRGQNSFICDMDEINSRPILNGREYGEQEIWDNFRFFMDRALPVCEQSGVKLSLHPNDPPVASLGGVHSLIYNAGCYEKAFDLVGNSPYLTMKLCIGCWLESSSFGNLKEDIRRFTQQHKISIVHFRNVSGQMPYFEETLLEDGYADMYEIMKQLVAAGYDGFLNIDHPFFRSDGKGMSDISAAYLTGYMKALLNAAEKDLSERSMT
jgi:mannonate dehydratase